MSDEHVNSQEAVLMTMTLRRSCMQPKNQTEPTLSDSNIALLCMAGVLFDERQLKEVLDVVNHRESNLTD